jgi:hypothetical protein
MLTGEPGMDAAELAAWRRFYRRHPFGLLRGDLQMWLAARNIVEAFNGGLRPQGRAGLGMAKHRRKPLGKVKTALTPDRLATFAQMIGCPFTPGSSAVASK